MRSLLLITALFPLVVAFGCQRPESRVVVYCAQDQEFAEGVFADFQKESGLTVAPKFDTEANKSVSLVAELQQEAGRPRCDVHWNNEILGTIRAARSGLYEPYESPNAAGHPDWSKAKDRTWQAFAERARVLIVNTNLVPEADRPKSILELTDPKWKGKVAMAKPQFGTTATHAACLFEVLGPDAAKAFYRGLQANDVQIVPGNKQSARGVADGQFRHPGPSCRPRAPDPLAAHLADATSAASSAAASRPVTATLAPAPARATAKAEPMDPPPPATRATRSSRRKMSSWLIGAFLFGVGETRRSSIIEDETYQPLWGRVCERMC